MKALFELNKYDIVISHGVPSAVFVALYRRIFRTKAKHIVFDIGCMNSAAESGMAMRLLQFASKSIDYVIYHAEVQADYYKKNLSLASE